MIAEVCPPSNYDQLSTELPKVSQNAVRIQRSKIICRYATKLFFKSTDIPSKIEATSTLLTTCIDALKPEELKKFAEIACYQNNEIRVTDLSFIATVVRKCLSVTRKLVGPKKKGKQNAYLLEKQAQVYVENLSNEIDRLAQNKVINS